MESPALYSTLFCVHLMLNLVLRIRYFVRMKHLSTLTLSPIGQFGSPDHTLRTHSIHLINNVPKIDRYSVASKLSNIYYRKIIKILLLLLCK